MHEQTYVFCETNMSKERLFKSLIFLTVFSVLFDSLFSLIFGVFSSPKCNDFVLRPR